MMRRTRPAHAPVRRWRVVGAVAALVAVVGGLAAIAYFTPLMSVRSVDVTGTATIDTGEVLRVAQTPVGKPLLQVDTAQIADRVSALPAVESVNVSRGYPSTLTIAVTERTPLVILERGGEVGVMDRLGMVYLTADSVEALPEDLRGLPTLKTADARAGNPTTMAALEVVGELPDWLRGRVRTVSAGSPSDLSLRLASDRTVIWGDASRTADKAEALRRLLVVDGEQYNVSSPEFAAVR